LNLVAGNTSKLSSETVVDDRYNRESGLFENAVKLQDSFCKINLGR